MTENEQICSKDVIVYAEVQMNGEQFGRTKIRENRAKAVFFLSEKRKWAEYI